MKLIHILYNFDKVVGKITLCKKNDTKWIVEKFTMASDHKNKIFEKILRFNLVRKMKDD
jgi:hypothetical protein